MAARSGSAAVFALIAGPLNQGFGRHLVIHGGHADGWRTIGRLERILKLYGLPPRAGASVDAASFEIGALGKPILSLQVEKLLFRRSEDRTKRDCLEVVIFKSKKGKLQQMALFEGQKAEDVLELYTGSPFEFRAWMAALRSPRYLLARGAVGQLRQRMDPRRYNGAMFLGLNGIAVKSHGGTDALGFANAIGVAADMKRYGFLEKVREELTNGRLDRPDQQQPTAVATA